MTERPVVLLNAIFSFVILAMFWVDTVQLIRLWEPVFNTCTVIYLLLCSLFLSLSHTHTHNDRKCWRWHGMATARWYVSWSDNYQHKMKLRRSQISSFSEGCLTSRELFAILIVVSPKKSVDEPGHRCSPFTLSLNLSLKKFSVAADGHRCSGRLRGRLCRATADT